MAAFFNFSNSIDLIEVEELLLHRYYQMDYILALPFMEGRSFIDKAYERQLEERVWQRWLTDYQRMTQDTFMNYEEYKEKFMGSFIKDYALDSREDLLSQAENILSKVSQKGGE